MLKLISVAITCIKSHGGVAVMSPVLQVRGPGFESPWNPKTVCQIKVDFI